ncbi:MAG: FxsA family protein, partial [Candidatus Marinimicrobia bacterium]|nr:FxsA family protein [Candidatus Neomarinimicrobiota bacterium]
ATTRIDGALVLVGGFILLTPGFCTDLLGFSFLVPSTRDIWRATLSLWLEKQVRQGSVRVHRM